MLHMIHRWTPATCIHARHQGTRADVACHLRGWLAHNIRTAIVGQSTPGSDGGCRDGVLDVHGFRGKLLLCLWCGTRAGCEGSANKTKQIACFWNDRFSRRVTQLSANTRCLRNRAPRRSGEHQALSTFNLQQQAAGSHVYRLVRTAVVAVYYKK